MGRREDRGFHEIGDVMIHGIPSKRTLNLPRHTYEPFGSFYSNLRHRRRTWLPEAKQTPLSHLTAQIERLVERARLVSVPDDIRPVFESMLCLAPTLVDHSNGWERFESEIESVRGRFEKEGPTSRLFADNSPGRGSFLTRLHSIRKAIRAENPIEKIILPLLFGFASSVGAREKWRSGMNEWEKGVRGARNFEIDSFPWDYRNCLIEARYQMIGLGRALAEENPAATFNRTRIKNRASILYVVAHSRKSEISLSAVKSEVRKCRKEVNWEAYLNKLPRPLFPKKDSV
jgi:hypothetical protein